MSSQYTRSLTTKRLESSENRIKSSQKELSDTEDKFDDQEVFRKSKPRRSLRRKECKESECERIQMPCIEKQMARITNLQPLRARIQSINSSPEDQVTEGRIDPSVHGLISTGVPTCYQSKTKEENPKIFQKVYHPQTHWYNSSFLISTEDLYCDDELHPSLENIPHMKLFTQDIHNHAMHHDELADDGEDHNLLTEHIDDDIPESILSMEMPSTGPGSLISCVGEDTDTHSRDATYSTVIAWGVHSTSGEDSSGE